MNDQTQSTFSAEAFLNTTFTEANDTKYVNVPEPQELNKDNYIAVITAIQPEPWQAKDGSGASGVSLVVTWKIDDDDVRTYTGQDNNLVRQRVRLEVTSNSGLASGKGKNVPLGLLRTAVNQNIEGQTWGPGMLVGQVARINVKHRPFTDRNTGEACISAEVNGVAKL